MIGWIAAALLALGQAQPAASAARPDLSPEAVSPEHQPARLDSLLAARDYMTLGRTIRDVSRQPDLVSDLDWLKERMMEGNSAFVTMLYSRLVWAAAEGLPEEPKNQWRQTAAMATLFAYSAITIDGTRCGDASAPSRRAEQLTQWNPPLFPFIRSLSPQHRQRLIDVAVMLERRTAARRDAIGDVDFLCRGGLEETRYNLEHGTAREVPTPPGGFGRTIELSGDGGYRPSERPEAEWRERAERLRTALPADLAGFVGAITGAVRPD